MTIDAVMGLQKHEDVLILDIRPLHDFANGFIGGSIFLPEHKYAIDNFLHVLMRGAQRIVIVANPEQKVYGWLSNFMEQSDSFKGDILQWSAEMAAQLQGKLDLIIMVEPDELAMDIPFDSMLELADIRSEQDYEEGHLAGAQLLTLEDLTDPANISLLGDNSNIYLYCSNGDRSMVAASYIKSHGMHNLRVIDGTWQDLTATPGLRVEKDAKKLN